MFEPNLVGQIAKFTGRDVHSRPSFAEPIDCPFGIVNLQVTAQKTSVRADSSASRGSTDETAAQRAKILIAPFIAVGIGDRFSFDGMTFHITSRHVRRSIMGTVDHFECDMEIVPT